MSLTFAKSLMLKNLTNERDPRYLVLYHRARMYPQTRPREPTMSPIFGIMQPLHNMSHPNLKIPLMEA